MEQNNSSLPKKNPLSMQIDLDKFAPATEEEKRQQDVMSKSTTFFRDGMRKLFKNPLAVGSLIVLSLIIITIIVAPMIVPYKYSEILSVNGRRDKGAKNMAPFTYSEMEQEYIAQGGQRFPHIFGTDEQCRDYFVRVIYGTRVSLCVGLFASIIVMIIGVIYGSISGYLGGKVDLIMMRIVDIIYSLPDMLMVILLAVVFDELIHFPNGSLLNKLGANMISLFLVFGPPYPGPDTFHKGERLHTGRGVHRRRLRAHNPKAHSAQLHIGHNHNHRPADTLGHIYRELPFLYRYGRPCPYALSGFPRKLRPRRTAVIPL